LPSAKELHFLLFMFMGPRIFIYEDHISNQRDATFFCYLLIAKLYMFRTSLTHCQEFTNCVCSLWYRHVDLCNDWWHNLVYGVMVNVLQYNVDVYWLRVRRSRSLEGTRSRNPHPINVDIVLYDISHNLIDQIEPPVIT